MTRVIWCTPSRRDEAELISSVAAAGCTVVRRCLEAADLLAAAELEPQAAIVVDVAVPRLGADIVASIDRAGSGRIIAVIDDEAGMARAQAWGVDQVIDMRSGDARDQLVTALTSASAPVSATSTTQVNMRSEGGAPANDSKAARAGVRGRIVVVTGPPGAPGRTTVALGLAEAWAQAGERVCLIDADTIAPSLAATVGITEDVSGLLLAARYADQGALDARSLGSSCRKLTERLWVLTGIGSPDRWNTARASALDRIWAACAQHFDQVVVDAGTLLDTPAVDDPFATGQERDTATVSALRASDLTVVVTRPEPVAILRLIHQLPAITKSIDSSTIRVLVNRASKADKSAAKRVADALLDAGMPLPVEQLREDSGVQACVRKGALLSEVSATMRLRRSFTRLARDLTR
ncbi:MAG TPA: hypothetical protein VGP37_02475 [Candidatus Nanopelagicales bacterium]|nr:hypothetical protein [Candidatus Nanopelagicales bacterium]